MYTYRVISTGAIRAYGIEYLNLFRKIRLQIKPQYQIFVLTELLLLLNIRPDLLAFVRTIKCSLDYNIISQKKLSSIKIDCSAARFNDLLCLISNHFNKWESEISLNNRPRYTRAYEIARYVSSYIYWSIVDGDLKHALAERNQLTQYFDGEVDFHPAIINHLIDFKSIDLLKYQIETAKRSADQDIETAKRSADQDIETAKRSADQDIETMEHFNNTHKRLKIDLSNSI